MSPDLGRDTSSLWSGVQASSRAPGTRAHTVTVQPGGTCSCRETSNGSAPVPASGRTSVPASAGTVGEATDEGDGAVALEGSGTPTGSSAEHAAARVSTRPPVTTARRGVLTALLYPLVRHHATRRPLSPRSWSCGWRKSPHPGKRPTTTPRSRG